VHGSMVHIQSATAEIRRGKGKKKPQDENIMSASSTQGSHNNDFSNVRYISPRFMEDPTWTDLHLVCTYVVVACDKLVGDKCDGCKYAVVG